MVNDILKEIQTEMKEEKARWGNIENAILTSLTVTIDPSGAIWMWSVCVSYEGEDSGWQSADGGLRNRLGYAPDGYFKRGRFAFYTYEEFDHLLSATINSEEPSPIEKPNAGMMLAASLMTSGLLHDDVTVKQLADWCERFSSKEQE